MPGRVGGNPEPNRGCLYKLVVSNFKSYAGTLTIGPFKDFTCVIGPNGSGKSNLMDAVSFVVGVNTTQLRGAKLADFRSHNLSSATDEPTSVTLYYHSPSSDGDEPEEVQFTRTITVRDTSEYRVDGRKVDEKEYTKKLKSVGLLVKSRNFLVFQNEVEAVAQKSPKQLTELLERISGSEDLKSEYDDLLVKKKESSESELNVYMHLNHIIKKERQSFKDQVKEADDYKKMQTEVADLKAQRYLFELFQIDKKLKSKAEEAEQHSEKLEACEKNCKSVEKAVKKKEEEKAVKMKDSVDLEKKVHACNEAITDIKNRDISKHEKFVKKYKGDIQKNEEHIDKKEKELEKLSQAIKSDKKIHETHTKDLEAKKRENKTKEIELNGEQESRYSVLKAECGKKAHKLGQELTSLEAELSKKELELKNEEDNKRDLIKRWEHLDSRIKDQGKMNDVNVKTLDDNKQKLQQIKSEMQDLDEKIKRRRADHKVLEDKSNALQQELGEAAGAKRDESKRQEFKANLEMLKSCFPGVRGCVSDLCKVRDKKYELALAVTMDANMDAIVVEKEEIVKQCIEHLQDKRVRAMNFLPLDSISATPPDERLRMINGATLAFDLLTIEDKSLEKAMWYATGNTVVVPTFEKAKQLAFGPGERINCKIVSANDASVISKSGAITGGDFSKFANKAQRFGAGDVDNLRAKLKKTAQSLKDIQDEITKDKEKHKVLVTNSQHLEHRIKSAAKQIRDEEKDLETRKKEHGMLKDKEDKMEPRIKELSKSIENKRKEVGKVSAQLKTVQDEVYKDFCAELKIKNISEFEGGTLREQRERKHELNTLSSLVSNFKQKILCNERDHEKIRNQLSGHKSDLKDLQKDIKESEEKVNEAKKKLKDAMEKKAEQQRKLDIVKADIKEIEDKKREVQNVLKKTQEEREDAQKQHDEAESRIESLSLQRVSLVEQSQMEGVDLPKRRSGSDEGEEDQMEVDESAGRSQSAKKAMKAISDVRIDYSKLPREHKKDMQDKEMKKVLNELEEKQKNIVARLSTMNPNMKAFEELKIIEAKYDEVSRELSEAKQKSNDLAQKYESVKKKRCEMFNACFDHVKGCIDKIYKELTSDPTRPEQSVGGAAYLTLNNQDEPYLDGIKYDTIPPGKRFMDMTHLSGGEKTVAALALLFAINSFFPAPFIVLDEVDAALDARNVAKVTRYIQARREEQQCVIISLKERFYEKADGLVGICRDKNGGHSNVFTLDLTQYGEV